VQAAGLSPAALAQQIQERLKEFINVPRVTVAVEEIRPLSVPVLGEVARPGQYNLERGSAFSRRSPRLAGSAISPTAIASSCSGASRRRCASVHVPGALARPGTGGAFRLQAGDAVVVE